MSNIPNLTGFNLVFTEPIKYADTSIFLSVYSLIDFANILPYALVPAYVQIYIILPTLAADEMKIIPHFLFLDLNFGSIALVRNVYEPIFMFNISLISL